YRFFNDEPCQGLSLWQKVKRVAKAFGKGLVAPIKSAFESAINAALRLAGIKPDDFWSALSRLAANAQSLFERGATWITRTVENFIEGAWQGFTDFADNFVDNFLAGLGEWLSLPPSIFSLVTKFDLTKVPQVLLDLIGYGWDDIFALIQSVVQD